MQKITLLETLRYLKETEKGVLVLFGGKDCGVCQSILPKLTVLMNEHFPCINMVYVDCHTAQEVCGQEGVLSLPTLQIFLQGQCVFEGVRTFSLQHMVDAIKRPYELVF